MRELDEAIKEIRRELLVRGVVYPRMVAQGKLTQSEADRRMLALQDGLGALVRFRDSGMNHRLTTVGRVTTTP